MERSTVAADVQRSAFNQRAQFGKIELSAFNDRGALICCELCARLADDRCRSRGIRRTGREDDTALRIF